MKIAIITPGILPIPALKGGAVETLTEYLIEYNEQVLGDEITVFGNYDSVLSGFDFSKYKKTTFNFLFYSSLILRAKRTAYRFFNKRFYYNYYLDFFIYEICRRISHQNFDTVVIENRPGFVLPVSKSTKAKIILHLHNDTLDKETKDAKEIVNTCSQILTVSNYIRKKVLTITPTDKVLVLYNGIDLFRFNSIQQHNISRATLGINDNDFAVVYTGRIEPIKGIIELLKAFLLLKKHSNIRLVIVGGDIKNTKKRNQFMNEILQLSSKIGEQVIFIGFQPYEKIPAILKLCDVGVIPSIGEDALTMTSLEDMAVGLPLIVTRSGGIPEAVDEKCAIIVENNNNLVSNLAKEILALYYDKNKRTEMSLHAIERAKLFSKETYTSTFFSYLNEGK